MAPRRKAAESLMPTGYVEFLASVKARIGLVQTRAALAVNRELLQLYWQLGRDIVRRQENEKWGAGVIERLARDLRRAFPGIQGFSASNIWRMRSFFVAYSDSAPKLAQPVRGTGTGRKLAQAVRQIDVDVLPQAVADLPWGHHVVPLEKVKDSTHRSWYAYQACHHGWSRSILLHQIESRLHRRQGKAVTNFERTLPAAQSDLARELLKDPYNFDFLTLASDAQERDLERGLLQHVRNFLIELGVGFAFVGSQVHLEVGGADFYVDLLFYHLRLRCFVVVELKTGDFKPEYAGKLNFYLSAIDDQMRHADDRPSVGLILGKAKNRVVVEYALRDTKKPIGVAAYRLTEKLPAQFKGSLPTIAQLEQELAAPEDA